LSTTGVDAAITSSYDQSQCVSIFLAKQLCSSGNYEIARVENNLISIRVILLAVTAEIFQGAVIESSDWDDDRDARLPASREIQAIISAEVEPREQVRQKDADEVNPDRDKDDDFNHGYYSLHFNTKRIDRSISTNRKRNFCRKTEK
jgi:hypothetical protein